MIFPWSVLTASGNDLVFLFLHNSVFIVVHVFFKSWGPRRGIRGNDFQNFHLSYTSSVTSGISSTWSELGNDFMPENCLVLSGNWTSQVRFSYRRCEIDIAAAERSRTLTSAASWPGYLSYEGTVQHSVVAWEQTGSPRQRSEGGRGDCSPENN